MKTNIKKIYTCFPGGKHKVLTMSYDDGKHEDRRLVALFNQYGIKGTFNVISGLEGDPVRIPQAEYPHRSPKRKKTACESAADRRSCAPVLSAGNEPPLFRRSGYCLSECGSD